MKRVLILAFIGLNLCSYAQEVEVPQDGYFCSKNLRGAEPTPYPQIRASDIMTVKRVWRDIDTEDNANKLFTAPESNLIDIIVDAIQNEKIKAYSSSRSQTNPSGDAFSDPISAKEALKAFISESIMIPILDSTGTQIDSKMKGGEFNPSMVTKFRLKEDWIFDKGRGLYEPRIVGIAPLIKINAVGELVAEQPAFWINFEQARKVFCQKQVLTMYTSDLSYDDIFTLRKFKSKVIKEASPADLKIKDYVSSQEDIDREAQRIESSLADYGKMIWTKNSSIN